MMERLKDLAGIALKDVDFSFISAAYDRLSALHEANLPRHRRLWSTREVFTNVFECLHVI